MPEEKLKIYNEILDALVSESIACSPAPWESGTLTINCDGRAINYKLKNEEDANTAQISDELRGLCEQLYVVMRENTDTWVEALIHFYKQDDSWNFKVKFEYEE